MNATGNQRGSYPQSSGPARYPRRWAEPFGTIVVRCYRFSNMLTQPTRHLLPLWDYGWLDYTEFELPAGHDWRKVIEYYLAGESFATSFVGPELDHAPELHGPFRRSLITADDFELLGVDDFYDYIRRVRHELFEEAPGEEQWRAVEALVGEVQARYMWLIRLRPTEDDSDKFHDWGYVLCLFREFLLINSGSAQVSRLVLGYD